MFKTLTCDVLEVTTLIGIVGTLIGRPLEAPLIMEDKSYKKSNILLNIIPNVINMYVPLNLGF